MKFAIGATFATMTLACGADSPAPVLRNEPPGMTVIMQHDFSTITGSGLEFSTGRGTVGVASDADAPRSPSNVLEFGFPAGFVAGHSPGTMYYPPTLTRHVFVDLWIKPNAGWQSHPVENKFQFLWVNGQPMYMSFNWAGTDRYEVNVAPQFRQAEYVASVGSAPFIAGRWNRVEWEVRMNDAGQANGLMRVWVNGAPRIDLRNLDWFPPTGGFENYLITPVWGGTGGTKSSGNDYIRVDHVYISGR